MLDISGLDGLILIQMGTCIKRISARDSLKVLQIGQLNRCCIRRVPLDDAEILSVGSILAQA
jgi:hypothetical protein